MAKKTLSDPSQQSANIAAKALWRAKARRLEFSGKFMDVYLKDGRMLRVPLKWYARLDRATEDQRRKYEFSMEGRGLHWPDIDEDISVEGLLKGWKAPTSGPYITGKWPEHVELERKRIETSHKKSSKLIPSKRATATIRRSAKSGR
jgi:hypothetical protein